MNIKNYIHIGFGKCASTKLQNDILPHIAKLKNLTYCGSNRHSNKNRILILQKKILRHLSRVQLGLDIDKIKMGDNYLISNEEKH